ncbi:hypothetical protein ACQ4PT_023359 [Festuca glaucescens]
MAEGESIGTENLNIDELENTMTRKLTNYRVLCKNHDQETQLCAIFTVRKHLKQVDKLSYEPMVVSVGPNFHGNSSFLFMEKVKWNCLDYVLKLNSRQRLEDYLTVMEGAEKQARSCYSEEAMLETNIFLRVLLLDGCFVLIYLGGTVGLNPEQSIKTEIREHNAREGAKTEKMRSGAGICIMDSTQGAEHTSSISSVDEYECFNHSERDPVLSWYDSRAFRDLFLLENQLPFFIVKKVYELLVGVDSADDLTKKVCKCLEYNVNKYTTVAHEFI